jgi:hypothetical protein
VSSVSLPYLGVVSLGIETEDAQIAGGEVCVSESTAFRSSDSHKRRTRKDDGMNAAAPHGTPRKVPRPFTMPWGAGQVVEEVAVPTEYNELVVQLLRYDDPDIPPALRFCQYWLDGRFQRQPMMLSERNITELRDALRSAPAIRRLLTQLLDEAAS